MSHTKYIKPGQVTVFSKSYCPFCTKVESLFKQKNVPYKIYQADQNEITAQEFNDLKAATGQSSVPNVFFGTSHIGGCDHTFNLAKNEANWNSKLGQNGIAF